MSQRDRGDPATYGEHRPFQPDAELGGSTLWINTDSYLGEGGGDQHGLTSAQFMALEHPSCPGCGQPLYVKAVRLDPEGGSGGAIAHEVGGYRWTVGSWSCPAACSPLGPGQTPSAAQRDGGYAATAARWKSRSMENSRKQNAERGPCTGTTTSGDGSDTDAHSGSDD